MPQTSRNNRTGRVGVKCPPVTFLIGKPFASSSPSSTRPVPSFVQSDQIKLGEMGSPEPSLRARCNQFFVFLPLLPAPANCRCFKGEHYLLTKSCRSFPTSRINHQKTLARIVSRVAGGLEVPSDLGSARSLLPGFARRAGTTAPRFLPSCFSPPRRQGPAQPRTVPQVERQEKAIIPPPFLKARYGNLQTLPSPTA